MNKNKILNGISAYKSRFFKVSAISLFAIVSMVAVPNLAFAATATAPDLGTAGNFVVLSKAAITDVPTSAITGDVGASPITGAAIAVSCSEVTGTIWQVDDAYTSASTTCAVSGTANSNAGKTYVDTAILDMGTAYDTAVDVTANPAGTGAFLDVGSGTLGTPGVSRDFVPGVYTWGTAVTITDDIYLNGSATDVWVFQISGTLDISSAKQVHLTGGAMPANVFWAVTGNVTLGTTSVFEGNILTTGTSHIAMLTGATLHGRALSDGEVWLQSSTVSATAPLSSNKDITSFSFSEGTGVITGNNIVVNVPSGTNLTSLTPTIGITGASVSPLSVVTQNFTSPVTYTVTAENGTTKVYTVIVGTYYNDIIKTADRLVALQNANGSWDWVVTNQTGPSATTYYNVTGVTAQALLDAYALNNNQTYLDAAKKAGDFIVGTATSTSQRQNAYNIVFLQDLATASASSTYGTKANDILNNIFNEDNYWAYNNGSYCTATGCTADQLVSAYADYRSGGRGLVPWDVAPFVSAEVHAGNTALAQALVDAIVSDSANYDNTDASYDLGLAGKVIAAAAVNHSELSTYVAELVSRQNGDGSFGLAGDGQVQITSYALKALVAAGGNISERNLAATFLGLKFGYSGIDGWMDTDGAEYAEVDSESAHALFSVLPSSIPYATFTNAVTQTGTSGSVAVTVDIPQGIAVTGDSSWDGVLDPPTETAAIVAISGFNTTVTSAITVGSSDSDLTFDKAVRLVFTGQAGTHAGWYNHAGTFTEITADCATTGGDVEASQTTNLGAGASCKMDVGADLVIWTKHFSTFVTYTQTPTPAPAPAPVSVGGGGGFMSSSGGFKAYFNPNEATPATPAVPTVSPAIPATPAGKVLGASTFNFLRGLGYGVRNDDVTELQNRLTAEGVYFGPITGYFGPLTTQGVKNFQKKYGISQVGLVGPQTRARLNSKMEDGILGCAFGNKFSTTTGHSCSVPESSKPGCFADNKFSITTGKSCSE